MGTRRVGVGKDGGVQRQGTGIERRRDLELMGKREDREEIGTAPVETSQERIGFCRDNFPRKLAPGNAVHGELVIVEVQQRRRWVEGNVAAGGLIF